MTPLRQRMIEVMNLRNLAPRTVKVYVERIAKFAQYFGRSPEKLGPADVRAYLVLQRRIPCPTSHAPPPVSGASLSVAGGRLSVPRHTPVGPPQNLVEVPDASVQQMDEQRSHLGDGHLRLFFPPTELVEARETSVRA